MKLRATKYLLLCAMVSVVPLIGVPAQSADSVDLAKLKRSIDHFAALLSHYHDAGSAAWDCLAAVSAKSVAPQITKAKMTAAADYLVETGTQGGAGRVGWGYDQTIVGKGCKASGELSTFSHAICNPAQTHYAFESGLAITCLARAYEVTRNQSYLATAKQAMHAWSDLGSNAKDCPTCFTYWYSDQSGDRGRYVRNSNVLMGMANAWLFHATGENGYRDRAQAVANAERRELAAGNYGYFGIDDERYAKDPQGESQRIENHVPYVAKGLFDIGRVLKDPQITNASATAMRAWMACDNARCRSRDCQVWAAQPGQCQMNVTLAPCFLSSLGSPFRQYCVQAADNVAVFSNYQIWALLDH